MDLTTATPQAIDKELYRIHIAIGNASAKIAARRQSLKRLEERGEGNSVAAVTVLNDIQDAIDLQHKLADEAAPYNAEFMRRGCWTRAFLVVNNGTGHVHSTMNCTTCYPTTQYHWLTELSDHDEQDIVDAAGEGACTVCYGSAPVKLRLDRPRAVFTDEERARIAEREKKAQAKVAAAAQAITVDRYWDVTRWTRKTFKTERAATNAIASELSSMVGYGASHPSFPQWQESVNNVAQALKDGGSDYDLEAALEKARKKCRAEHAKVRKSAQWEMYKTQGLLDPAALVDGYDPVKF